MSKEQAHELQEQHQQPQLASNQPQFQQPQPDQQQQTVPTEPQPSHNHIPNPETATEHQPPSYEQARGAPVGQPPADMAPGQAARTVTPLNQLGDTPQYIDCPFCHQRTKTVVRKEGGSMQFVVGAVLCLVCICLTCLPCMLHWFEDTDWFCSKCNTKVATRKNEGAIEVLGPPQLVYSQYGHGAPMNGPQQQQQHQQPQPAPGQQAQQPIPQHQDSLQQQQEIQPQPPHTTATAQHPVDVKN
ncbi:LPS-induced tumor necrosis factor alpha factor [Cordyceps fumosorosea ARSEF 2679]|uniref:LPS-induced tumor necrosis factor alpha factor n=1 Tax=Cordyceps fumosorosea (strain ARSEF 2679) TaxID=1081104 RepID=A0A167N4Y9_CORFA|nr:LPS-induced tumor necrosis factor alpha factor [Cordyceps fumosorosea ARSEF 2679]OAA55132.1 LPS-induced tumor necrosis factor alpha factor [Cordyceps fumosorosea ARSEF 2679]